MIGIQPISDLYALVYCDLVEYQYVGNIKSPLLRVVGLDGTNKTINWIQFHTPHYIPIKYQQFQDFTVGVYNEKGEKLSDRIFVTLHFRKSINSL